MKISVFSAERIFSGEGRGRMVRQADGAGRVCNAGGQIAAKGSLYFGGMVRTPMPGRHFPMGQAFAASAGMQKRRLMTARGGRGPQAARRCAAGKRAKPASALPGAAPGLRPAFPTPQAPERGSVTGPKGRPAPTAGRCASGRTDKTTTGERCRARRYTAPAGWRQIPSSTGSR